jgi:hypothetical protein
MGRLSRETTEALQRGIGLCRRDDWDAGLKFLGRLAESDERAALPGLFYSYLGYGIARCEGRTAEGLKLCNHAIKVEFYQPDNYLNLARTCLLTKDRSGAVDAIRRGLAVDRNHVELKALARELGVRRPPVLTFLSRDNPLNYFLGWLRHRLSRS